MTAADPIRLDCPCGRVALEVAGAPILSCECACTSCRTAASAFAGRAGGVDPRTTAGTTHYVLHRKDRVRCLTGEDLLASHKLTPSSKTRRVVAACCQTPMFLEFTRGHWLSLYAARWPANVRPAPTLRTMARDLPPGEVLPDDLPNSRTQPARFMLKLLGAWVAMGFRVPAVDFVQGGTFDA